MALTLQVPLARNEAGDLQVEGTRVFLEDILEAYERGSPRRRWWRTGSGRRPAPGRA
ncbi:hypothetical protein [Thermus sp. 93170]|uniref:hypothetical protein n=1 Tax=Thermus sp. 93170 TaxID=1046939 RepID=UPI003F43324E